MNELTNRIISIFLPTKPCAGFNFANLKAVVMLSCSDSEDVSYENTITEYPIEYSGSDNDQNQNISDNIYSKPLSISINGNISDISSDLFGNIQTAITEKSFDVYSKNGKSRSVQMWEMLEEANRSKQVFTVVLDKKQYINMFFESLKISKDKSSGKSINVSATLKQIHFAKHPNTEKAPEQMNSTAGGAYNSTVNNGIVQPQTTDKVVAQDSSLALKLYNILPG